jgi:hypothetical protein
MIRKLTLILSLSFSTAGLSQTLSPTRIEVNPELELFSIVTYLSGNIQFVIPSSYETLIKKEFRSFRKHPAVSGIRELYKKKKLTIEAVHPMLAFHCSPLPQLQVIYPVEGIDSASLEHYLKYLRNFAQEINYHDFIAAQKSEMESWAKPVRDTVEKYKLTDKLGMFFGRHKTFYIYLNPFNSWGGEAFTRKDTSDLYVASFLLGYNIYTANAGPDNPPFFNNRDMLIDLIWHEGTHTYINPGISKNLHLFDREVLLDENLQTMLQKAGRFKWEWEYFLKEQITRAVVAFLLRKNFTQNEWQKECSKQEQLGFIYTRDLSVLLEKFDQNKESYPDFENFLPEIARYFNEQTKER